MVKSNPDRFYYNIVGLMKIFTRPLVRLQVMGANNIPAEGGTILVLNHVSTLDPVLVGVALSSRRPIRALAKSSLFKAPVVGKVMTKMGHVPVHRGTNAAKNSLIEAETHIKNGQVIGIYPEGTISKPDEDLGTYKTGAARLAILTGAPIVPVAQYGAQKIIPPWTKHAWTGLFKAVFTRPKHYILVGEPIIPQENETVEQLNTRLRETTLKMLKTLPNWGK